MKNKFLKTVTILSAVFCMSACQGQNRSNLSGRPYSEVLKELDVKMLRTPQESSREISRALLNDEKYLTFKEKIGVFSHKLSEAFVESEYNTNQNIIISPLSIEMCLGLAVSCASGETRQELLTALDIDYATFSKYYKFFYDDLSRLINNDYKEIESELTLTNSIWIDNDVELLDSGLDDLKDNYYCHSFAADFGSEHNKETVQAMQHFIEQQTHGLIKPELSFSPNTLFVLMNTLYLKDLWNDWGGDLNTTSKYAFKNANGNVSDKQLLQGYYLPGRALKTDDYSCFHTETSNYLRIYFVKPNEGKTLKSVFNKETMAYVLDDTNYIYQDDEKLERYYTNCVFPEFKADSEIDLINMFKNNFNVETLFDYDTCDFSNITNKEGYIEQFKHIAKLDVNKSGIEGAAVTYMAYAGKAGPDQYKDVNETFVVDQEFGLILTNYYGDVIFSGAVTNID